MPLISITFHSCFLSIIYARAIANDLATETTSYLATSYIYLPIPVCVPSPSYLQCSTIMYFFSSSTLLSTRQCAYASSGCDKKKITLYRNFFRNLNFKNTVNFFKRTCWDLMLAEVFSFKNYLLRSSFVSFLALLNTISLIPKKWSVV